MYIDMPMYQKHMLGCGYIMYAADNKYMASEQSKMPASAVSKAKSEPGYRSNLDRPGSNFGNIQFPSIGNSYFADRDDCGVSSYSSAIKPNFTEVCLSV